MLLLRSVYRLCGNGERGLPPSSRRRGASPRRVLTFVWRANGCTYLAVSLVYALYAAVAFAAPSADSWLREEAAVG